MTNHQWIKYLFYCDIYIYCSLTIPKHRTRKNGKYIAHLNINFEQNRNFTVYIVWKEIYHRRWCLFSFQVILLVFPYLNTLNVLRYGNQHILSMIPQISWEEEKKCSNDQNIFIQASPTVKISKRLSQRAWQNIEHVHATTFSNALFLEKLHSSLRYIRSFFGR